MDDTKIISFLTLAKTLNYTKAAEELFKAQSVLSRHITSLENELGVTLFSRNTKEVTLTPAGKIFADGMRELSDRFETILQETYAVQEGNAGTINFGILSGKTMLDRFMDIVLPFNQKNKDVKIYLGGHDMGTLRGLLSEQQLDFVFSAVHHYTDIPGLEYLVVGRLRNGLFVPKDHPLANEDPDTLRLIDFENEKFIHYSEDESPTGKRGMLNQCERAGFTPDALVAPNLNTLMLWLEARRGVAILDEDYALRANTNMKFIPLKELGYTEEGFIWNKYNDTPLNKRFLDFLKKL